MFNVTEATFEEHTFVVRLVREPNVICFRVSFLGLVFGVVVGRCGESVPYLCHATNQSAPNSEKERRIENTRKGK